MPGAPRKFAPSYPGPYSQSQCSETENERQSSELYDRQNSRQAREDSHIKASNPRLIFPRASPTTTRKSRSERKSKPPVTDETDSQDSRAILRSANRKRKRQTQFEDRQRKEMTRRKTSSETIDDLTKKNQLRELESKLGLLTAFMRKRGLEENAPEDIRAILASDTASSHPDAHPIFEKIRQAFAIMKSVAVERIGSRGQAKFQGNALDQVLNEIDEIRQAEDGDLATAYDAVLHFKSLSRRVLSNDPENQSLMKKADNVLMVIAEERRENGQTWDIEEDLLQLEKEGRQMERHGWKTWYPSMVDLLERWT